MPGNHRFFETQVSEFIRMNVGIIGGNITASFDGFPLREGGNR